MSTNILYISYDGLTDPLGQAQILPYIVGLSKKGYTFTVISAEKPNRYKKEESTIWLICKQSNIDWRPILYTKSPPVISTVYDVWRIRRYAKKCHAKKPFDIIHCRSYIAALVGLYFKRKHKVPFVFDMRGFWADERVDGQIWNTKHLIYKKIYAFFKKKEQMFLGEAAYTISLTNKAKKHILKGAFFRGSMSPSIKVIPCCADLNLFNQVNIEEHQREQIKLKLDIKDQFVLTYLGSIGTWYMLDEMLDFFKVLLKTIPHALFLFITQEDKQFILKKALDKGIDVLSLRFYAASRNEVPSSLSIGHVSIFFIRPLFSKMASSPTKQGEIMGMGIPIVCNRDIGDTDYIVEESKAGVIVDTFSTRAYQKAIDQIPHMLSAEKKDIIQGAYRFYSLDLGVKKYAEVYESILEL